MQEASTAGSWFYTLFEKITKAKKTEGKVQVIESTCLVQALVRTKSKNLE
jgi:hypothetical protein